MSEPPSTIPVRAEIEQATRLRAVGHSWDQVAQRIRPGLTAAEVESWPLKYPDLWDSLFLAANRRLAAESEAEARAVLRTDLRATKDKERRDIAKKLIDQGRRTTPGQAAQFASEAQHLADYLEELNHDQLRTHLEELLADLEGDRPDDCDRPPVD